MVSHYSSEEYMQAFLRRYCLVRDARVMLLKAQWAKWESQHVKPALRDAKVQKGNAGFSFGSPAEVLKPGPSTERKEVELVLVCDAIKQLVGRQYVL
jgi:hypothetical protein